VPDDILPFDKTKDAALSRRAFGALSLGVGAAVTTSAMAAGAVVESDIVIKMADGSCGAALFYPLGNGSWPGAVIFTDALGLRSGVPRHGPAAEAENRRNAAASRSSMPRYSRSGSTPLSVCLVGRINSAACCSGSNASASYIMPLKRWHMQ
jgi:hypothetical protein